VANFEKIGNMIGAQIGMECNAYLLESIKKGKKVTPKEPTAVTNEEGTMTKPEEISSRRSIQGILLKWRGSNRS